MWAERTEWPNKWRHQLDVNDQRAVDLNQVDLNPWSRALVEFSSDSPVEMGLVNITDAAKHEAQFSSGEEKGVSA